MKHVASRPRGEVRFGLIVALALLAAPAVRAAEPSSSRLTVAGKPPEVAGAPVAPAAAPDPEPWQIGVTAYAWAINMSGNSTAHGQTVDFNASFLDLVQKSSSLAAFMGYFEADKGRVGFYGDLIWTKLGFTRNVTSYRNPLPGLTLTLNGNAALTTELTVAEVGGLYELHKWSGSDRSFTAVDALLGFRYWNSTASATLDGLATANFAPLGISATRSIGIDLSSTMQWVDPVIGARLRHQFTPSQSVLVRGDVGGFGLGSQFSWQALGVYSYRWKMDGFDLAAVAGYRAIGTRYSTGSGVNASGMDLVMHGPVIGLGVRF
jgi:hypothetical protein